MLPIGHWAGQKEGKQRSRHQDDDSQSFLVLCWHYWYAWETNPGLLHEWSVESRRRLACQNHQFCQKGQVLVKKQPKVSLGRAGEKQGGVYVRVAPLLARPRMGGRA